MFPELFKDASFLPHGFCLLWDPWLIGAHLFSDLAIFIAYAAIPVAIYIFLSKRPGLAMSNLAWLFALFILFCGLTHLASAVALYQPIYVTQAVIKVMTAVISLATAIVIFPLIPKALAIPSPEELQQVNRQLQSEVESHRQTADALRVARDELQKRVEEQVTALSRASAVIAALEESASVLIYAKTVDGKMLMANPAAIAAIGRPAGDVIGKDESEFLSDPVEIAAIADVDKTVRTTQKPVTAVERVTRPDGTVSVYLSTKVPLRTEDGTIEGIVGVSVDISEREALMVKLTRSEELLRLGSEAARFGICDYDTTDQTLQVSEAVRSMLGLPNESIDVSDIQKKVLEADWPAMAKALQSTAPAEIEFRAGDEPKWYLMRGQQCMTDGKPHFLGAIVDITRRKRAELRTADLMRELIHRGRNLLTVVQVLARNSLIRPRSLEEGRDILLDRLHAFARGYELFVDGDHLGLTFRELLMAESSRFADQFTLSGPEFILNERASQTLGLVIHEMTTNAAKYGALSTANGRVSIDWKTGADDLLHFVWQETGGPVVTSPAKKGFGSNLIARVLKTDFAAHAQWDYAPEGHIFTFTAPLDKLRAQSVGRKASVLDGSEGQWLPINPILSH